VKWNIRKTFTKLTNFIDLDNSNITRLNVYVRNNKELLSYCISHENIQEIHGDRYFRNIFLSNGKFYFYDRIEFNASLGYANIAEDIDHLVMDLDYHEREDLRKYLIDYYIKNVGTVR
jgi:aminoglycoside phosphotransferase family enzyme